MEKTRLLSKLNAQCSKLKVTALALLLSASGNALALGTDWTEVTTLPTDANELAKYYYVFVEQNSGNGLMLHLAQAQKNVSTGIADVKSLYYATALDDPLSDSTYVFTLEYSSTDSKYGVRNIKSENKTWMLQTEGKNASYLLRTHDQKGLNTWTEWTFAYDATNKYWTIGDGNYKNVYWGPWEADAFTDGSELAGNKTDANIGHFKIYQYDRVNSATNGTASNPSDMTFKLTNPTLYTNNTGWTEEHSGGNATCKESTQEFFNNNTFNFSQSVMLPAGYYKLSVNAFNRASGNDKAAAYLAGTETIIPYLYVTVGETTYKTSLASLYSEKNTGSDENAGYYADNMGQAASAFAAGHYVNNLYFYVPSESSVTVGIKTENGGQWVIFNNFTLTYFGNTADDVTLSDASDYTADAKVGKVSVSRSLSTDKWAAVVLPFDVPASAIETVFGSSAKVAAFANATLSDGTLTIAFNTNNPAVKANVPFLVKAGEAKSSISTDVAYIAAGSTVSDATSDAATLTGIYKNIANLATTVGNKQAFYIKDDKWYKAASGSTVTVKPFRAYLTVPAATASAAKRITAFIDGVEDLGAVTAIEKVMNETSDVANGTNVYNLNGQLVNADNLPKGIYIINGKKIIIK